jgi:sec-independent protein translocase protein TatA
MGLKWGEMLLIFGALLLLFGGSRLPQLGSSLGSAIRNFKRGFSGEAGGDEPKDDKKLPESGNASNIVQNDANTQKRG